MRNVGFARAPLLLTLGPIVVAAFGCASAAPKKHVAVKAPAAPSVAPPAAPSPPKAKTNDLAEGAAKIARWRAWEPKREMPHHRIQFPDVGMTADVESMTPPEIECKKLKVGLICSANIDLGVDDDGTQKALSCSVLVDLPFPFGVFFKRVLAGRAIEEIPNVDVETSPQGMSARLIAPSYIQVDGKTVFGTTKAAASFGSGFTLACEDNGAGASAAFRRISTGFFQSAAFASPPAVPSLRTASKHRIGDAVRGFSLQSVAKVDEGYAETTLSFRFDTDGKKWEVFDRLKTLERNAKGAVDTARTVAWLDGGGAVVVSAKPSESGRIRVKLEAEGKSDSLEITPKAPLSTGLWEAPTLLKVSNGAIKGHRYGFLSVSSDGEPTIAYYVQTRAKAGVLFEEVDDGPQKKKGAADAPEKTEIALDEHGFPKKQVSSEITYERIFLNGELPARAGAGRARKRTP